MKKLNRNGKIAVGVAAAAVLVGIIAAVALNKNNNDNAADKNPESTAQTETADTGKENKDTAKKDDESSEVIDETSSPESGSANQGGSSDNIIYVTPSPVEGPTSTPVVLPYTIPNSDLVIEQIVSYDGQYLEDGSDADISNLATMIISNQGSKPVEFADIHLNSGSTEFWFTASDIPAGSRVIAQEKNKNAYTGEAYSDCTASVAVIDAFDMDEKVQVTENGGSLSVTNLTDSAIPCVRIFYKLYMEEENAYVGGITYVAKITDLRANATLNVTPSHYAQGYSKIMMVRTYDTTD